MEYTSQLIVMSNKYKFFVYLNIMNVIVVVICEGFIYNSFLTCSFEHIDSLRRVQVWKETSLEHLLDLSLKPYSK